MNASGLLPLLVCGLLLFQECTCWTYHTSKENMNYTEAEKWCKANFTNLVAIQTQQEIEYLNATLDKNANHYWIGLRKIDDQWRWVGTNKTLSKSAENWAAGEPNGKRLNEDCVEIYIKRVKDSGKWNDERCDKKKAALCYTASCKPGSCSRRGECVETINDYSCICNAGFYGRDCQHVRICEPLHEPDHGTLECNKAERDFIYNSSCRVQCGEGYEPTREEAVWCTSSGTWSAPIPVCKAVKCEAVVRPVRGFVNCSQADAELVFNSTCRFGCEEGYALRGPSQIQCSSKGLWSATTPRCEVVKCEAVPQLEDGFVKCSHADTELFTNSTCRFSCEEGYTLRGSSQIQCSSQGQWSAPIPRCGVVKCEAVPQPEGGFVNCSRTNTELVSNSTCQFRCEEGYTLRGLSEIHCSSKGLWSAPIPHCEAVKCEAVPQLESGFVHCSHADTELVTNSTCRFSCEEGYTLRGSSKIQCSSKGQWSALIPHCEVVKCEAVAQPENGIVSCSHANTELVSNSTCRFGCKEGYTLRGSAKIQCSSQGLWSAAIPQCEAVKCDPVPQPESGFVNCSHADTELVFNSTCQFGCKDGYTLRGSSQIQCSSQGLWSAPVPHCEDKSSALGGVAKCKSLTAPEKGFLNCSHLDVGHGMLCEVSCMEGRVLQGSSTLLCLASGNWTTELPTCEAPQWDVASFVAIAAGATGAFLLSVGSFLIWLVKRLRRKAEKFTPASSCQSLDPEGTFQITAHLI
ncbi:E-selectin [Paroedura picta]|uniref:E-selectin n=1 Tax=Paroedura picta TaxID=143630 RepID=UPI004056D62E